MSGVIRAYKDTIFSSLYYTDTDAKKNLAELYNGIYPDEYVDVKDIELVRLEQTIFGGMYNDAAFTAKGRRILLTEHQSTVNMNMPLRFLLYVAREYERMIPAESRYKKNLIYIPTPEFISFYNGVDPLPMEQTLRLSDAFYLDNTEELPHLELIVRVININPEAKHPLLEKCKTLGEYSEFVSTVRRYGNNPEYMTLAVQECRKKGLLKDFLDRHASEVVNMLLTEYNYEEDIRVQREEAKEEGRQEEKLNTERERQRAESERQRAENEKQRAENALREVEMLRQKLAELGSDH